LQLHDAMFVLDDFEADEATGGDREGFLDRVRFKLSKRAPTTNLPSWPTSILYPGRQRDKSFFAKWISSASATSFWDFREDALVPRDVG
jgi:hypothetical protein